MLFYSLRARGEVEIPDNEVVKVLSLKAKKSGDGDRETRYLQSTYQGSNITRIVTREKWDAWPGEVTTVRKD